MDRTTEVVYGQTGQPIATFVPEWNLGVPSSATAKVYPGSESNDNAADFEPSVTVDSTSTTVDTASGYSQTNRRKLYLTSTSGVTVQDLYVVTNLTGQCELVRPVYIATNDYLILDADLAYDYAVTSTFKGCKLSFTVDPTWVADEGNILAPEDPAYRVIWSYTVASVARRHYTYLRLVRQKATHNVTLKDLGGYNPDLGLEEPASVRGQQYQWAIQAADDRLRIDIVNSGWKPEQPRDTETMNELRRRLSIWIIERQKWMAGDEGRAVLVESCKKDYDDLLASAISAALHIDVDEGTEGGSSSEPLGHLLFTR